MLASPARPFSRLAAVACLGLGLAGPPQRGDAQCTVLAAPGKFDPPTSGLPSYFQFQGRRNALSAGGTAGTARLAVRYNYGFLVYSLANPGAPTVLSIEDLLLGDHYPKNGDGQERVGAVTLSADATRALQPWTDVAGYGTIAMSSTGSAFASGGDFLPIGEQARGLALLKVGSRYLGFVASEQGITAADITEYQSDVGPAVKNGIYSELIANGGVSSPSGLTALEAAGRSYVVAWSNNTVAARQRLDPRPRRFGPHVELHVAVLLLLAARPFGNGLSHGRGGGSPPVGRRAAHPGGGFDIPGRGRLRVRRRHAEPGRPVDRRPDARRRLPASDGGEEVPEPGRPPSFRRRGHGVLPRRQGRRRPPAGGPFVHELPHEPGGNGCGVPPTHAGALARREEGFRRKRLSSTSSTCSGPT